LWLCSISQNYFLPWINGDRHEFPGQRLSMVGENDVSEHEIQSGPGELFAPKREDEQVQSAMPV